MIEHLTTRELDDYVRGEASAEDMLRSDDHLAVCSACRTAANSLTPVETRLGSLAGDYRSVAAIESDHLDFEEIAAYLDDKSSSPEIVASHLAVCTDCTREFDQLRDFKNTIVPPLNDDRSPALAHYHTDSAKRRLGVMNFLAGWSPAWRAAAAAALVITVVAVVTVLWTSQRKAVDQGNVVVTTQEGPRVPSSPEATIEAARPPVLMALNDAAGTVTLDRDRKLSGLPDLSSTTEEAVRAALQKQTVVNTSALSGLGGRDGALMSGSASGNEVFGIIAPVGRVIESDRPSFRWNALPEASGYTVKVFDENFSVVDESPTITATTWQVGVALRRGSNYSWQVTARKNGEEVKSPRPPAPQARFKVLDGATAAELSRLKQARPQSRLALGVVFARAGLLEESERELRALLSANQQSEVVRKLLDEVRAARRGR